MNPLSVNPWKGPHFASTRLLLLGESAYSWRNDRGEVVHPSAQHPTEQVRGIIAKFDDPDQPFMQALSRALTNEKAPQRDRLGFVWDRVAFANFVPGTVGVRGETDNTRPGRNDWERGRSEFPALLEEVKPLRMIQFGTVAWSELPSADVGEGLGAHAFRLSTGELCWCQAFAHPAHGGVSWRTLASAIYFTFADQFRAT